MTDRYVLFGNPVEHSPSPRVHAAFAAQTGQDMTYDRLLVPLGEFATAAGAFFAGGGRGGNVTLPFKADAYRFASRLTERARRAGAVNTLAVEADGGVFGDNTDGVGLVRDLTANLGWVIAGRRVLVLGAGGATRGALGPLLEQRPALLHIANHTAEKAVELAWEFADLGAVRGGGYPELVTEAPKDQAPLGRAHQQPRTTRSIRRSSSGQPAWSPWARVAGLSPRISSTFNRVLRQRNGVSPELVLRSSG